MTYGSSSARIWSACRSTPVRGITDLAVSAYTENRYESEDLDFVTAALLEDLRPVLEPLGFIHTSSSRLSVFEHPDTPWYLEFPPAPLSFGGTYVDASEGTVFATPHGEIRIITPTRSVMDRLSAAAVWHDPSALEQAVLVAKHQEGSIEWSEIERWVVAEGIDSSSEVMAFFRKMKRPLQG